jgi:hypothetical protein
VLEGGASGLVVAAFCFDLTEAAPGTLVSRVELQRTMAAGCGERSVSRDKMRQSQIEMEVRSLRPSLDGKSGELYSRCALPCLAGYDAEKQQRIRIVGVLTVNRLIVHGGFGQSSGGVMQQPLTQGVRLVRGLKRCVRNAGAEFRLGFFHQRHGMEVAAHVVPEKPH